MNEALLKFCLSGATCDFFGTSIERPVDFIFEAGGQVLCVYSNWQYKEDAQDNNFEIFPGSVQTINDGLFELVAGTTAILQVHSPEDQEYESAISSARFMHDTEDGRGLYLDRLRDLQAGFGPEWGEQFERWAELISVRPIRNANAELLAADSALRDVVILFLQDSTGKRIDVLVCDELGNAATANGNPWLETLGSMWMTSTQKSTMPELAEWLNRQRPYGAFSAEDVRATRQEGSVSEIAEYTLQ